MTLHPLLKVNIKHYYLINLCKNLEPFSFAQKIHFLILLNLG